MLRVVPTSGPPMTPATDKVAQEGLSDIGAAQLAGLISPVVLLGADRDLVRHDIAPLEWQRVWAQPGRLGSGESRGPGDHGPLRCTPAAARPAL
ncbi:hypothetical protein ABZT51_42530 [Streptomyces sp. NPDC005373]|uniref:hypothetical protein n=1 Tax=Streptomyces sp. NPDC005373 TaxID=3156879 RepID=UPI0033AB4819